MWLSRRRLTRRILLSPPLHTLPPHTPLLPTMLFAILLILTLTTPFSDATTHVSVVYPAQLTNTTEVVVPVAAGATKTANLDLATHATPFSVLKLRLLNDGGTSSAHVVGLPDVGLATRLGGSVEARTVEVSTGPLSVGTPLDVEVPLNCSVPARSEEDGVEDVLSVVVTLSDGAGSVVVHSFQVQVTCVIPGLSCESLNHCSGHGVCGAAPLAPFVLCSCSPDYYFGKSCSGSHSVQPVGPFPVGSPISCPGAVEITLAYSDEQEFFPGDISVMVDPFNINRFYDLKFLTGSRTDVPTFPIAEATLTHEVSVPGPYLFSWVASGDTTVAFKVINVLEWAPPCTLTSCNPLDPIASCSNRGACTGIATLGAPFCQCNDYFYGPHCEYGCAQESFSSSVAVRISDSSPHDLTIPFDTNCSWVWTPDIPSGTMPDATILLTIDFLNIGLDNPVVIESLLPPPLAPPPVYLAGTTTPSTPISLPLGPIRVHLELSPFTFKVSFGFDMTFRISGCPAGYVVDTSVIPSDGLGSMDQYCSPCPAGTFSSSPDSSECLPCAPGTFSSAPGAYICKACPPGSISPSERGTECSLCAPGSFAQEEGMATCSACAPGSFSSLAGTDRCVLCGLESYQPEEGSTSCLPCPANTQTEVGGGLAATECSCKPEHYHPDSLATFSVTGSQNASTSGDFVFGKPCTPCPEGGVCLGQTAPPVALPGWWASSAEPTKFLQCVEERACVGGPPQSCASTRMGTLCSDCPTNEYETESGTCKECSTINRSALYLALFGAAFILLVFRHIANLNENDNLRSTIGLGTSLGIFFQWLQFAFLFSTFQVRWPRSTKSVLTVFAIFNLDPRALSPTCAISISYLAGYVLRLLIPFAIAVYFLVIHVLDSVSRPLVKKVSRPILSCLLPSAINYERAGAIARDPNVSVFTRVRARVSYAVGSFLLSDTGMEAKASVNAVFLFCEVFYIFIITTTFEVFGCKNNKWGVDTLVANPEIECFSSQWYSELLPPAIIFMVLYVVVLPGILMYGVYVVHSTEEKMNDRHFLFWSLFSSVVFKFKRSYRWWMFVVLGRKLTIAVVIASFPDSPVVQAFASIFVLFLCIVAQISVRPYRLAMLNTVDSFLASANLLILLCGVLFYIDNFESQTVWEMIVVISLILVASSIVFIIVVVSIEIYRVITDRPVSATSTMEELFARRHIRWSPQLQPILSLLHVSRAALFRYLSICSDDDLVKLRQVAAAVSLSLAQTQSMNTSMGLLSLSKHYGIHSNDSADDTGMSEPGYTRTVPYIPASVRTSSALGGRANSLPSLNSSNASKRSSKVSPTGGLPRTSSGKARRIQIARADVSSIRSEVTSAAAVASATSFSSGLDDHAPLEDVAISPSSSSSSSSSSSTSTSHIV